MKAFLDYNGHNVPVVVWEKILHIRKKFHLSIVGLDIVGALTENDYNVLTVYVESARCISSRHFKNIECKAYRKLMARYGWDICFVESEEMLPYIQAISPIDNNVVDRRIKLTSAVIKSMRTLYQLEILKNQ